MSALLLTGDPHIGQMASDWIFYAPCQTQYKWDALKGILRMASRAKYPHWLLGLATEVCPASERGTLKDAVLDIIRYEKSGLSEAYKVLSKRVDSDCISPLREIAESAALDNAYYACRILSEWKDTGSARAIREAIENHQYNNSARLSEMLHYLLQISPAESPYVSGIFLELDRNIQLQFLNQGVNNAKAGKNCVLVEEVAKLAESEEDLELQKKAIEYLAQCRQAD